jgi:hypothetical protein
MIEAHAAFERGLKLAEAFGDTAHQLRLLSGIPVAADVGVAGDAADRLLPFVLVAADQEIGDSFFGDNATRTDFRRRGVMLGTSFVRSS